MCLGWSAIEYLIGQTPLINIAPALSIAGPLFVKCEFQNPTGSHKIRTYAAMLKAAEKAGNVQKGIEVVDYSTGNGSAALAWLCARRGYACTAIMPDGLPEARYVQTKSYGAKIIKSPGPATNVAAARARADEYVRESPNTRWLINQSDNPANPLGFVNLAKEIIEQLSGTELKTFVCGFGTGGTLTGTARILKQHFPKLKIIGVEVDRSPVLWNERTGNVNAPQFHNVIGFSPGKIAKVMDTSLVGQIELISEVEAAECAEHIRQCTGHWVGTSSGASVAVATRILKSDPAASPCLTFLWDAGWKY